ncbi:hypothetical protein EYF80_068246 [Liparis tanakae]|uniref:Uncharacterized protein n=1 Tax=Liparis tanakae TaxID=230148 RepID=A0A4Z2DYK8_9TELE|nr:hypothetical protein EYF80_068246 [Liparis tanakae]
MKLWQRKANRKEGENPDGLMSKIKEVSVDREEREMKARNWGSVSPSATCTAPFSSHSKIRSFMV